MKSKFVAPLNWILPRRKSGMNLSRRASGENSEPKSHELLNGFLTLRSFIRKCIAMSVARSFVAFLT